MSRLASKALAASAEMTERLTRRLHQLADRAAPDALWNRRVVGGLWETMGQLQFDYLAGEGLRPEHRLLDVGCGSLRGGLHFIRYLDARRYVGIDESPQIIGAARREMNQAGLAAKEPTLEVEGRFDVERFGQFDFALAQSVFSHLPLNPIMRCISGLEAALRPGGRFYATFFPSPGPRLRREPTVVPAVDGELTVNCDADPFYYDPDIFTWMCAGSSLAVDYRGDWGHPRGQHMLCFTRAAQPPA